MRHFAVVGSGPAGFYTAEALEKAYGEKARIDILDRYAVPYGLIRFGVAPDHQSLKAVSKRYDKVAESPGVDFIGNVCVGSDVSVAELLELYDAVILAIGAPHDRKLGIEGEEGLEAGAALGAEKAAEDGIHVFSEEDAWDVLEDIPNDSAAALLLIEHHWAVPLRDAVVRAGGFRLAEGFISPLDLVAIGLVTAEEAKALQAQEAAAEERAGVAAAS